MRKCIAIILLSGLLLSGCWNRLEVNDLGVVTGVGVDVGQESAVRVTLFIARAVQGKLTTAPGGPGPVWVVAREGPNVADAMRNLFRTSPRRISLHHVQVILLGEEYARQNVADVMDFLMREAQIRQSAWPIVVAGRAQEVFEAEPTMEALQTQALFEVIEAEDLKPQRLKEFLSARIALTHSGWMYSIQTRERPARQPGTPTIGVEHLGAGLYKGDKLQAMASPEETQLLLWLLGSARSSVFTAGCPGQEGKSFSVALDNSGAKIKPARQGAAPGFQVELAAQVNLTRSECALSPIKPSERGRLEQAMAKRVQASTGALIRRLQGLGVDPAGFGKRIQLKQTAYWKRISSRWPEVWKEAPVSVSAEITIVHGGLLRRPLNKTEPEMMP